VSQADEGAYDCVVTNGCGSVTSNSAPLSVTGCAVLADITGDGFVNVSDLLTLLAAWGVCPAGDCPADIAPPDDGDGDVNVSDLLLLLANWTPS
jgi:hypothetical protein